MKLKASESSLRSPPSYTKSYLFISSLVIYKKKKGVPIVVKQKQIRLGTMRLRVRFLASLSGLKIRYCRELWCRLQMKLGPDVAVAVV